jgi:membrane protein YqaA with SNARE-associated domain
VPTWTAWLTAALLSPIGLVALAAIDNTLLVAAPLVVDTAVVVLVARHRHLFWLYPLLATAGSVAGAAVTFLVGRRVGEAGLHRFASRARLERALARSRSAGAVALAMLGLMPPPFPFTAVILAAGALEVKFTRFLTALAAGRLVRFGLEAALALLYGRRILGWLQSDAVKVAAAVVLTAMIAATAYSAIRLWKRRGPAVH